MWKKTTGSRAAGREAQTPRLVGACERQARVFLGGARCAACSVVKAPPQKKRGIGVEAAAVRAPLLCISPLHQKEEKFVDRRGDAVLDACVFHSLPTEELSAGFAEGSTSRKTDI